jgi:hypothetical protein
MFFCIPTEAVGGYVTHDVTMLYTVFHIVTSNPRICAASKRIILIFIVSMLYIIFDIKFYTQI